MSFIRWNIFTDKWKIHKTQKKIIVRYKNDDKSSSNRIKGHKEVNHQKVFTEVALTTRSLVVRQGFYFDNMYIVCFTMRPLQKVMVERKSDNLKILH